MKINNMKIKISKKQWEELGKTAGWIKKANFEEKMMPGQTPYTDEEKAKLKSLISDAAEGDPGEQGEQKDPFKKMRYIRVTFNDGDVLETQINGTKKEVEDHYLKHNFVKSDEKTMHHGIKVEFLD
jgi:hypothetical protein